MTNLRDLNRAVQDAEYPGHRFAQAAREWIAAATERMEPASEVTQAEPRVRDIAETCPRCLELASTPHHRLSSKNLCPEWVCLPAHFDDEEPEQPEPAPPSEMPEAVREAVEKLRRSGNYDRTADRLESFALMAFRPVPESPMGVVEDAVADLRLYAKDHIGTAGAAIWERADALESWWRSQPAPAIRMTEELEMVLRAAEFAAAGERQLEAEIISESVAAVRAQAETVEPVRLPKVRDGIEILLSKCSALHNMPVGHYKGMLQEMLAELDAVEAAQK